MKIEKGMHIRTIDGTIAKVTDNKDNVIVLTDDNTTHLRSKVVKASYDIIDLIEVGDYVNGHRVYRMHRHATNGYLILELELGYDDGYGGEYDDSILEEDIESIVTHEQFDNIKYEVE